jgi:hypothetical protein
MPTKGNLFLIRDAHSTTMIDRNKFQEFTERYKILREREFIGNFRKMP